MCAPVPCRHEINACTCRIRACAASARGRDSAIASSLPNDDKMSVEAPTPPLPFRLAIAFSGAVGSFGGAMPLNANASGGAEGSSSGLFNVSSTCWRRTLLDRAPSPGLAASIFVHSWSVRLEEHIKQTLRPVAAVFEPQPAFPRVPYNPSFSNASMATRLHCHEAKKRAGYSYVNHQSLWASRLRVMKLVVAHEQSSGLAFHAVLLTRLDMCPCQGEPITAAPFILPKGTAMRVGLFHAHCGLPFCRNRTGAGTQTRDLPWTRSVRLVDCSYSTAPRSLLALCLPCMYALQHVMYMYALRSLTSRRRSSPCVRSFHARHRHRARVWAALCRWRDC